MILCITPNPAVDRTLILSQLIPGRIHRAERLIVAAGGKGLNVARAIRLLGGDPLCMGFLGGHTGHLLADLAQAEGLNSAWTWVATETRACTILVSPDSDATVINETGMPLPASSWMQLQEDVRQSVADASIVCISGSLPPDPSMPDLERLLSMLTSQRKQVWVDTSGEALHTALDQPDICVKVNGDEIGAILEFTVNDTTSAQRALTTVLHQRDLTAVVVTLGSAGAVLGTREGGWRAEGPRVDVVSTVGSGDVFLAGLVNALDKGKAWPEALGDAVAAGTANTLVAGGGRFDVEQFKKIREQVQIEAW